MSKIDIMAIKAKVIIAGLGLFGSDEAYMLQRLEDLMLQGMVMGYDLLAERCEKAEQTITMLTADHNSTPNYLRGFEMAQHHFQDFPDTPIRKPTPKDLTQGTAIFPIARVVVAGDKITEATMCAPGLPDGEHLLYPVLVEAAGVPV